MIAYPPSLQAVGGARTGIAPVNLLDVEDINGNLYFWSDRRIVAPYAIGVSNIAPAGIVAPVAPAANQRILWLLPTVVTSIQGTHVTASGDLTFGMLVCDYSKTFSVQGSIYWSGWSLPPLPAGTIVDAAYYCGIAGMTGSVPEGSDFALSGAQSNYSFDPALIPTLTKGAWLNATAGDSPVSPPAVLTIQSPCVAIYYRSPSGNSFSDAIAPYGSGGYDPWLLTVPELTFHRSSVTDVGSFVLQNLSGDTLARDFEKIMRKSALEGAFFVYRSWQPDAQASWIEVHGKLTVEDVGVDTVTLKGEPAINPAQDDTPLEEFAETCQLQWGQARCGATGTTECQYSFQTCQVVERIMAAPNSFEKNYGEAVANVPTQLINRRRRI